VQDLRTDIHRDLWDDLYRKRTPEHEILEILALLAEGVCISSLARAMGHKEDTILRRLRELDEIDHPLKKPGIDWQYIQAIKKRDDVGY